MAHEYAEGDPLPDTVRNWPDPRRGPWELRIFWRVQAGVAEPHGFAIFRMSAKSPRLGTSVLRTIPLSRIIEQWRAAAFEVLGDQAYDPKQARREAPDDLVAVADVYLKAVRAGRPTTRAVQDALHVSAVYARQLVHQARKRGLIPPTTAGTVSGRSTRKGSTR